MTKGQAMKYLKGILCALMAKRACLLQGLLAGGAVTQEQWDEFNYLWAYYQLMLKKYMCQVPNRTFGPKETAIFMNFSNFVDTYLNLCHDPVGQLPNFGVCNNLNAV